jgi:hypothetical protein
MIILLFLFQRKNTGGLFLQTKGPCAQKIIAIFFAKLNSAGLLDSDVFFFPRVGPHYVRKVEVVLLRQGHQLSERDCQNRFQEVLRKTCGTTGVGVMITILMRF